MQRWVRSLGLGAILTACIPAGRPPLLAQQVGPTGGWARGPALAPSSTSRPTAAKGEESPRQVVVQAARGYLRGEPLQARGLEFEPDPVGFARASFWSAGIDLFAAPEAVKPDTEGMQILYRSAARRQQLHRHTPRPGDLLLLDATSGQEGPFPAQVAIVERISAHGTIVAIGSFARGPARIRLNLRQPDAEVGPGGTRLNDRLDAPNPTPAARLFRAFVDPF